MHNIEEILCGLSWYRKLNILNLALAPGFSGERHIFFSECLHLTLLLFLWCNVIIHGPSLYHRKETGT